MSIHTFPDFEDQREWLADHLESSAGWREMKSAQYPEDTRNARCAETLHETAAAVKALPATHELLRKLAAIDYADDSVREGWLDEVTYVISKAGFHTADSAQGVIDQLIEVTAGCLTQWRQADQGVH